MPLTTTPIKERTWDLTPTEQAAFLLGMKTAADLLDEAAGIAKNPEVIQALGVQAQRLRSRKFATVLDDK